MQPHQRTAVPTAMWLEGGDWTLRQIVAVNVLQLFGKYKLFSIILCGRDFWRIFAVGLQHQTVVGVAPGMEEWCGTCVFCTSLL